MLFRWNRSRPWLMILTMYLGGAGFMGCAGRAGSSDSGLGQPGAFDGLMDLSALLQTLDSEGTAPPTKASQFRQFDVVHPAAGIMIPNGTIVYFRGGKIDQESPEERLVAMQLDADQSGGWVLLSSGEVKELSASDIQALQPAGDPVR